MTTPEQPESLQQRIAKVKERLADARARLPKHDVPAALIAEMDELDTELERLQALAKPGSLQKRIAELEKRLADARSRVPKHTVPPALVAEIDALDEELEFLRSLRDASSSR